MIGSIRLTPTEAIQHPKAGLVWHIQHADIARIILETVRATRTPYSVPDKIAIERTVLLLLADMEDKRKRQTK